MRVVVVLAAAATIVWAGVELFVQLRTFDMHAVARAAAAIPVTKLIASAAFTALSFIALGVIEVFACRMTGASRIPASHALTRGAMAHALCNTLGFHAVLAPSFRLAFYRAYRISAAEVARIVVVVGAAIVSGTVVLAALAMTVKWFGVVAALMLAALIGVAMYALPRLPTAVASWLPRPLLRTTPRIVIIAIAEALCAIAALYVLMPDAVQRDPAHFAVAFIASAAIGVVSHSPGGVGVFEAGMLAALPGDRAGVLAALLVFRVVYNLLPAAIAGLGLASGAARRLVSSTADTRGSHDAARGTTAPVRSHRSDDVHAGASRR
ncbi:uncharacterized membrane protein YbhN (UPF0104 family) [Lysobacter sp. HA18]